MSGTTIVFALLAGLAATATMDLLARVLRRLGMSAGAEGRWVGRWYLGILHGQFVHADIATSPRRPGEERAALVGHYGIGMALAVLYFSAGGAARLRPGTLDGNLTAQWYNPRTGQRSSAKADDRGGFVAPNELDWTLLLSKR